MKHALTAVLVTAVLGSMALGAQRSTAPVAEVFKTPTCGCCGKWVEHLRANGFTVNVTDLPDLSQIKADGKVPPQLQSCHTARIVGYVVEGHVPAADVKRLLKERPAIAGIAVAGMPMGSPGMEVYGIVHPYDVRTFGRDGKSSRLFASHGK